MSARTLPSLVVLLISACGGAAAVDQPTSNSQPPDSARVGASASAPEVLPDDQIQVVDSVDHTDGQYPATPAGSSAFFWSGGLGNWFASLSDGSAPRDATIDDVIPPRAESSKAYHHLGEVNEGTAVDLWAQLNHPQGSGVDLGSYSGIAFWARLNSPSGELTVAFGANGQFARIASAPQKVVSISQDWMRLVVRFDDLNLDATAVSSIDFVIGGRGAPNDLWVDDLALVCRGTCL